MIRTLADKLQLGSDVTITVLGGSSAGSIQSGDVDVGLGSEHTLRVGDQAVFFVWQRDLAWRGSDAPLTTRSVTMLMGAPEWSYLIQQRDGLYHSKNPREQPLTPDALLQKIARLRPS